MLSTPPAFILSQDQTLMLKFWFQSKFAWLILTVITVVLVLRKICILLIAFNSLMPASSHGLVFIANVLNVLLNFKAWPKAFVLRIFRVLHTVQFSRFFVVASAATFIVYQKFLLLSTLFYFFTNPRFFEIFLSSSRIFKSFLSFRVLFLSLSQGRMLWYQSIPGKSSIFLNLLFYMFFCDF